MASTPSDPGMTGSLKKWQSKNHASFFMSNSAMISPLSYSPPLSLM